MGRMPNDASPPGEISTRLVSFSADSADPPGINNYDSFAEGYTASNETSFVNTYYERPAMLALAGEVAGRRILDAGGGSVPTRTCRWPSWAARFPSPTALSTTSPRPWYCTTCRTGVRR